MASNYNRKSASSASRKRRARLDTRARPSAQGGRRTGVVSVPQSRKQKKQSPRLRSSRSYKAFAGGRSSAEAGRSKKKLTSVRVGELNRADRAARAHNAYKKHMMPVVVVALVIVILLIGSIVVYNSNLFAIENVKVSGVEHLTGDDMTQMASVPSNTTLLRVDSSGIRKRLLKNAWVKDVDVKRVFPHTLELSVTERSIAAVVEVPSKNAKTIKKWAIASDHMWLMPIPDPNSDAGKRTSSKVYEDVSAALSITGVPFGTQATIGAYCSDNNVNNALDIVSGLTTDLGNQVKSVSAVAAEETKLVLKNGVEIAFGKAEDVRDKERVCLKIMQDNPATVYINVRIVDSPTWRSA